MHFLQKQADYFSNDPRKQSLDLITAISFEHALSKFGMLDVVKYKHFYSYSIDIMSELLYCMSIDYLILYVLNFLLRTTSYLKTFGTKFVL